MPRIIHFDFTAEDPQRAQRFFQTVFGWKFEKWDDESMEYWMATTGSDTEPGINGGLSRRKPGVVGFLNTIQVSSVDEYIEKIQENGGEIIKKFSVPGVGYIAHFFDTEKNILGIIEYNKNAK